MNTRTKLLALSATVLAVGALWAAQTVRQLRSELAAVRQQLAQMDSRRTDEAVALLSQRDTDARRIPADRNLSRRMEELEQAVAQLARASDYLAERGQLPLATNKVEDLARLFSDGAAADKDRLRALGLLRRNRGMSDEVVQHALDWLQSSTNAGTRRELVQALGGVTNAAVKAPLLALMSTEQNGNVREEVAQNLRRFTDDPAVESALWNAALNDPDGDVREEAEDALREGPAGEARVAALRARATNPQSTLDEQLLALDALRNAKAPTSDIIAGMADLAQNTQDPLQRTRLFEAFDEFDDPATKVPLVHGLQDPNPLVREEAADALSRHTSDPAVREWLQYVANNDADLRVRREAMEALQERRR
ncbi:MAG: HEAT repeat domain-containing protein [Verrucomicrobiales bacterium]|nr:HEAT repeat domain-containing protein [Verrucomicrobiales bacterium]